MAWSKLYVQDRAGCIAGRGACDHTAKMCFSARCYASRECGTYLALRSVAVEAGLGGPVPSSVAQSELQSGIATEERDCDECAYLLRWSISTPRSKSIISPLNWRGAMCVWGTPESLSEESEDMCRPLKEERLAAQTTRKSNESGRNSTVDFMS